MLKKKMSGTGIETCIFILREERKDKKIYENSFITIFYLHTISTKNDNYFLRYSASYNEI